MPFLEESDPAAVEAWASQTNAQNTLTDLAQSTGASAAAEVRNGRPVERYGTQWEEVQQRLDEQHPGHGLDPEQARDYFQRARDATFQQQLLRPPKEGEGVRDEFMNYVQRIPVARNLFNIQRAGDQRGVVQRINSGDASQLDYFDYQQRLRDERYNADRPVLQQAVEALTAIPAFGAEMMLAQPFAGAAAARIGTPLGTGATSLVGRAIQGSPAWLASATVGAAAMPASAAGSIFQHINPHVGEADATAADVFKGYLDHQIEIASESLGEPLTHAAGALFGGASRGVGSLVSRLPGGARAAAVANGLTRWATNRLGSEGFQRQLRRTGFDGLLGEWLEERAGEVARGATGVHDNYGFTGNLAAGLTGDRRSMMGALDQLAVEGISFGGWGAITGLVGSTAANRAARRLQAQGMSATAAQEAVSHAAVAVLRDPAAVSSVQAPLREFAQGVAEVAHAQPQAQSAGQETPAAQPAAAPVQAETTAPEQSPPAAEAAPVAEAMPAVENRTAAPSETASNVQTATSGQEGAPAPAEALAPPKEGVPAQSLGQLWERVQARREIGKRMKAGEPVSLAEQGTAPPSMSEIATAAGLNAREAHILFERMDGRTLDSIAKDKEIAAGKPISRERVRQLEVRAREKAQIPNSIWETLSAEQPTRAGAVQVGEVSFSREQMADPALQAAVRRAKSPLSAREAKAKAIEEITNHILKEDVDGANQALERAGRGSLSPSDYQSVSDFARQYFAQAARQRESADTSATNAEARGLRGASTAEAQNTRAAATEGGVQANAEVPATRSLVGAEQSGPSVDQQSGRLGATQNVVLARMHESLKSSGLSAEKVAEYRANLESVLGNFNERASALIAKELKETNWHGSTRALTDALATVDTDVAALRASGRQAGGAYDRSTGQLDLDGDAPNQGRKQGRTGREIKAHEFGHVIDGANLQFSASQEWAAAHAAEAWFLGSYAETSPQESFAEYARLVGTGASVDSLRSEMPIATAFWEKNGLIGEGGTVEAKTPDQIFDQAVNNGPKHTDILSRLNRMLSPEFEAARAHLSPQGEANPTAASNTEAMKENAAAIAFEVRQRADDRLAIATDITAEVNKKRARLGLPPIPAGMDVRTVIAGTDPQVKAWAEEMAGQGMFVFDKAADDTRTKRTIGKSAAWIVEDMNYSPADLKSEGTGAWNNLKRKLGLPVEQGGSRLDTALTALHAVHQVERGQAMLDKYLTFITPEQEALAARLINTVSTEQLKAFDAYLTHERNNDPQFFANANESLRRLTQLNNWSLDAMKSVGWYNDESIERIKRDYPDYISLARVIEHEDFGGGGGGSEIKPGWEKKRHGSDLQIISPIKSLQSRYAETAFVMAKQLQFEALVRAGETLEGEHFKKADMAPGVRMTDIAEKLSALGINKAQQQQLIDVIGPELIEQMGAPKWNGNGQNYVVGRVDGKRVALEITSKPLYELLTDNQEPTAIVGGITKFVSAIPGLAEIPKMVKWGATTGNLVFPVRNMFRDPWHAIQNSKGTVLEKLGHLVMGHVAAFKAAGQSFVGKEIDDALTRLYFDATGQQLREFAYTKAGEGASAFRKLEGGTARQEQIIHGLHKIQEFGEVLGAGEHGPRLAAWKEALEEMGYTRGRIEAAMKADPSKSPIPLNVILFARQKAAERTTDFMRQGIDVREFNRITPFFSPHIAGMSQEIRNWKSTAEEWKRGEFGTKSKAMMGTLAMYLAFELLHWWKYKDDPWYKNLPQHLRYDWWILGQTKDGGTWGVPKPQGIMRMVGAFFQEGLRATSRSAPRFDLATDSAVGGALPRLLPVGISEAWQVGTNKDWRGANIVPGRDLREMNAFEQFRRHQLPYVLDQLTGGLASVRVLRGPLEAFQSSKSEPNQPISDYYKRLEAASGAHQLATRTRRPLPPEQAREYARLHSVEQAMQILNREARGDNGRMPTPERLREIRRIQLRLARRALGLPT